MHALPSPRILLRNLWLNVMHLNPLLHFCLFPSCCCQIQMPCHNPTLLLPPPLYDLSGTCWIPAPHWVASAPEP
jgi:hypothetical protein